MCDHVCPGILNSVVFTGTANTFVGRRRNLFPSVSIITLSQIFIEARDLVCTIISKDSLE